MTDASWNTVSADAASEHRAARGTLLLSPVAPDANGSGAQQRAFQWVLRLSAASPVFLIVAGDKGELTLPPATAEHIAACCMVPAKLPGIYRRVLFMAFPWLALWSRQGVGLWRRPGSPPGSPPGSFGETSDAPHWLSRVDRIVVFRLYLHDVALSVSHRLAGELPMEMDLDDLESATHLSLARLAILRRRPLTFLSNMAGAAQYRLIEQRCLAGYRTVYLASREDVEVLRSRLPLLAVESMPNRVLDRAIRRQRISGDKTLASFLFVGTLDYLPNEDAVLWLAEAIAIALDARLGGPFRLIVAGRGASKSLRRRLAKCLAVDFRGEVEELDALYEEAHAALIPLRGGGGTKLKLLEAFRYGCPVIATKHGVRGSGAGPGEHYLAAETADEFAEQCARLLENPDLGRKVAASARVLLEHSFLLRPVEAVRPR